MLLFFPCADALVWSSAGQKMQHRHTVARFLRLMLACQLDHSKLAPPPDRVAKGIPHGSR